MNGADHFITWGQVSLMAAGAAAVIIWSVSKLFKAMGASYGSIIAALQTQNTGQQSQIDGLRDKVDQSDKDCGERIDKIRAEHKKDMESVEGVVKEQAETRKVLVELSKSSVKSTVAITDASAAVVDLAKKIDPSEARNSSQPKDPTC